MAFELITLRKSMEQYERLDHRLKTILQCYEAAIVDVENDVFGTFAAKLGAQPVSFEAERRLLAGHPELHELQAVRDRFGSELARISRKMQTHLAGTVEMEEVIGLLSKTAAGLRQAGTGREESLRDVARSLDTAGNAISVEEFRSLVRVQVERISAIALEISRQNDVFLSDLECEMRDYRRKLDESVKALNTDDLTGLENRRGFEIRLRQHLDTGTAFTLILLHLNRFRQIFDRHGRRVADGLLLQFGQRLSREVNRDNFAGHWCAEEFVVMAPCGLRQAIAQAHSLEARLSGAYTIHGEGSEIQVEIGVSIGLAEARPGETCDELFARADALLYREKHAS